MRCSRSMEGKKKKETSQLWRLILQPLISLKIFMELPISMSNSLALLNIPYWRLHTRRSHIWYLLWSKTEWSKSGMEYFVFYPNPKAARRQEQSNILCSALCFSIRPIHQSELIRVKRPPLSKKQPMKMNLLDVWGFPICNNPLIAGNPSNRWGIFLFWDLYTSICKIRSTMWVLK